MNHISNQFIRQRVQQFSRMGRNHLSPIRYGFWDRLKKFVQNVTTSPRVREEERRWQENLELAGEHVAAEEEARQQRAEEAARRRQEAEKRRQEAEKRRQEADRRREEREKKQAEREKEREEQRKKREQKQREAELRKARQTPFSGIFYHSYMSGSYNETHHNSAIAEINAVKKALEDYGYAEKLPGETIEEAKQRVNQMVRGLSDVIRSRIKAERRQKGEDELAREYMKDAQYHPIRSRLKPLQEPILESQALYKMIFEEMENAGYPKRVPTSEPVVSLISPLSGTSSSPDPGPSPSGPSSSGPSPSDSSPSGPSPSGSSPSGSSRSSSPPPSGPSSPSSGYLSPPRPPPSSSRPPLSSSRSSSGPVQSSSSKSSEKYETGSLFDELNKQENFGQKKTQKPDSPVIKPSQPKTSQGPKPSGPENDDKDIKPNKLSRLKKLLFAAYRAPEGGMIVRGKFYPGGRMVPDLTGDFVNPPKRKDLTNQIQKFSQKWSEYQKKSTKTWKPKPQKVPFVPGTMNSIDLPAY